MQTLKLGSARVSIIITGGQEELLFELCSRGRDAAIRYRVLGMSSVHEPLTQEISRIPECELVEALDQTFLRAVLTAL